MALTADRPYEVQGRTQSFRAKSTTGVTYYKGSIVNLTAAGGLAIKAGDVASQGGTSGVVVTQKASVSGDDLIEVEQGRIWVPFASAAQAHVGDYVYATADDTIAMSATNADPIGKVIDVRVGVASLVDFFEGLPKTALA